MFLILEFYTALRVETFNGSFIPQTCCCLYSGSSIAMAGGSFPQMRCDF